MAQIMVTIRNDTRGVVAFFPKGTPLKDLREFRRTHPQLRHARIRESVQMCPSQIEVGKVYDQT